MTKKKKTLWLSQNQSNFLIHISTMSTKNSILTQHHHFPIYQVSPRGLILTSTTVTLEINTQKPSFK